MFDIMKFARARFAVGLLAMSLSATPAMAQGGEADEALTRAITDLDAKVFDAYNRCDLDAFASYFTPTVEFYHDQGGATFDRTTVVEDTQKYICGKVRREVLPATFKVYPIKDYGAIEEGEHIFCQIDSGKCEGAAKFIMIWENDNGTWKLTRIVSYGHRTLQEGELSKLKMPAKR